MCVCVCVRGGAGGGMSMCAAAYSLSNTCRDALLSLDPCKTILEICALFVAAVIFGNCREQQFIKCHQDR